MRYPTHRSLGILLILLFIFGCVPTQGEPSSNSFSSKAAGLVPQSGEGDEIRSAFNKNADRVRLMVLLSPT
jgi:hypothetical protein